MVFSNPPYVPAPDSRPPSRGPERAWDAGVDGRAVIDRICAEAPALLRPGGVLLMVHSGMFGAEETLDRLAGARPEPTDTLGAGRAGQTHREARCRQLMRQVPAG